MAFGVGRPNLGSLAEVRLLFKSSLSLSLHIYETQRLIRVPQSFQAGKGISHLTCSALKLPSSFATLFGFMKQTRSISATVE